MEKIEIFNQIRPRLFGIAYRMIGSSAEAEDILQEAYIRWHKAKVEEIETPEAWLVTVVTRLSIDRLRKVSLEREHYIGPWLPEPLIASTNFSPEQELEFASDLSLAFMVLLERLSPLERAVFLLHDIFDCGYSEIAKITGKSETSARQMIHRARERVRKDKTRFEANETERLQLIKKFSEASLTGNEKTLLSIFADEISMIADGGGNVNAARKPINGKARMARLFAVSRKKHSEVMEHFLITVNGEIGLLTYLDGKPNAVTTFEVDKGVITAMYRVMNPDKLQVLFDELSNLAINKIPLA